MIQYGAAVVSYPYDGLRGSVQLAEDSVMVSVSGVSARGDELFVWTAVAR